MAINAEKDDGNIEYKLFLKPKSEDRFKELISQMSYRLNEGNGECVYILGVTDLGETIGLTDNEYESSMVHLRKLLKANNSNIVSTFKKKITDERVLYEIIIRENIESKYIDIKVAVAGNVDSGKSTLIGVLTNGKYDNGRGSARLSVFNFSHEIKSGRTSSVAHHILGFDSEGKIVNNDLMKMDWTDIVKASSKIISFFDLAGHEKYLKTTIMGLSSSIPDICFITIGANMGITKMTKEHIFLCVMLNIPFCLIVTKIDITKDRENVMKETLSEIKILLKMPGIRRVTYKINNSEDVLLCSKNNNTNSIIPMFFCSNVTGEGIDHVKQFLNLLGKRKENSSKEKENVVFNTDTIFFVTGVGVVLGGHLTKGTIKNGDKLLLGPNKVGQYDEFQVKSIHCKKTLVSSVSASCYICVSLRKITRNMVRKGQVLLSSRDQIVSCREFVALVSVLKTHSTSIKVGYEPVLHLSTIRQTAKITDIQNKISSKKNSEYDDNILRTGDKAMIKFRFKYRPEFISIGSRILLAEGKIKILGQIKEIL